jgi:hypothetical protein
MLIQEVTVKVEGKLLSEESELVLVSVLEGVLWETREVETETCSEVVVSAIEGTGTSWLGEEELSMGVIPNLVVEMVLIRSPTGTGTEPDVGKADVVEGVRGSRGDKKPDEISSNCSTVIGSIWSLEWVVIVLMGVHVQWRVLGRQVAGCRQETGTGAW